MGRSQAAKVIVLDWDIRELPMGGAAAWLKHVNAIYRAWAVRAPAPGAGRVPYPRSLQWALGFWSVAEVERIPAKESLFRPIGWRWVKTIER